MTTQSEIKAILNRAADRLEKPGAWTQGVLARDADGNNCACVEEAAVCWDAAGAIYREAGSWTLFVDASGVAEREGGIDWRALSAWNDQKGRTQAEVVALLRKAAEEA